MLELKAEPLTADAFAPFGDVMDARTSASFPINAGRTQRHHDLATVETLGENAHTLINIFVSQPITLPRRQLSRRYLARHSIGTGARRGVFSGRSGRRRQQLR